MKIRSGIVVLGVLAAVAAAPGVAFADEDSAGGEDTTSQEPATSSETTTATDPGDEPAQDAPQDDEPVDEVPEPTDEVPEDVPDEVPEEPAEPDTSSGNSRVVDEPTAEPEPTAVLEPTAEPEPVAELADESEVRAAPEPPVDSGEEPVPTPEPVPDVDTAASASTELATMTATAASSAAEAVAPSPLELIGSWLFSALSGLVRLFDPKLTIPAGSLVTRRSSELEVGCGCGDTLDADWYFPNQSEEPTGLIYLQHGFFRSKANVASLALQLAEQTNSVVVVPTVASNPFAQGGCWVNGDAMHRAVAGLFAGDMAALTASASAAAGHQVVLPTQYVLAGQSAGGNLAAAAAGYTTHNDAIDRLRAVVMFDGVANGGGIAEGAAKLTGAAARPVFQIAADCGLCNAFGSGTSELVDARPDTFVGVRLEGGKHTDAEGASSGLIGMLTCGIPDSANVVAVPAIAAGWINDVFNGTQDGLYGAGGEQLLVGAATAVVLGTGSRPNAMLGSDPRRLVLY